MNTPSAADPVSIETNYEAGQDNIQILGFDVHNPVFMMSAVAMLIFVTGTIIAPQFALSTLGATKAWAIAHFDWLFVGGFNALLLFALALIVLPVGRIRLGGAEAQPEFSRPSWFAMLFAAGVGIGLMFWGVSEPLAYYTDWAGTPFNVEARSPEAAHLAVGATMYHWGFHPWAMYGMVALSLAYFSYNLGMPLTVRSAFYPLLGERCWGWPGHLIDFLAVIATLFGLATSLGIGAQQAASGLHYLTDVPQGLSTQIAVIAAVTGVALISVVRGIDGGVKVLSNINMAFAVALMLFVVVVGLGWGLFSALGSSLISYLQNIVPLSNWIGRDDTDYFHGWTVFYWAWWVSWSPFVGMFVARVSKGRTIREFVMVVLVVPTLLTWVWFTAFGGLAIEQAIAGSGTLADGISDVTLGLFHFLEQFPWALVTSLFGVILVLVFFITSSDSGSLVVDAITAGGKIDAPVAQRIFWAVMQGMIAGVLLFGGGADALEALRAGVVTAGLPFMLLVLVMAVGLYLALRKDPALK